VAPRWLGVTACGSRCVASSSARISLGRSGVLPVRGDLVRSGRLGDDDLSNTEPANLTQSGGHRHASSSSRSPRYSFVNSAALIFSSFSSNLPLRWANSAAISLALSAFLP
jgi:hypothetical protein